MGTNAGIVRYPPRDLWAMRDPAVEELERKRHRVALKTPQPCAWCGIKNPTVARQTCSHVCRSALARYEKAKKESRPLPSFHGIEHATPTLVRAARSMPWVCKECGSENPHDAPHCFECFGQRGQAS